MLDDDPEGSGGGGSSSHDGSSGSSSSSHDGSSDGSVASEAPDGSGSGGPASEAGTAAAPAPVRYLPDSARGTLRLLQGTKEPHLLKLVWWAERGSAASAGAAAAGPLRQQGQQGRQEEQPLNMFAPASSGPGSGSGGGGTSASRAALLGYMPAAAVEASAARGPIVREGCELWEAAAEFDWELLLPTPEGASSSVDSRSGGSGSAPAAIEARQLPNGAQLVLVTATGGGSRSSSGSSLWRSGGQGAKPAAAFWLQQRLESDSLQLPAYGTAAGGGRAPAAEGEVAAGETATPQAAQPEAQPPQEQQGVAEAAAGPAALLAGALQRLLRQPPAVDLRRLRKDVKSGDIQVSWAARLPAACACAHCPCFLRVAARSAAWQGAACAGSAASRSSTRTRPIPQPGLLWLPCPRPRRSRPSRWARCPPSLCGTLWAPAPPS